MANTQAWCNSAKLEVLNGIHALGTSVIRAATTPDSFKAALYLATATINAQTTAYTATGEVSGSGYSAGGVDLTGSPDWIAPAKSGETASAGTAYSTPTANIVFTTVTLSTAFDCVLIYNSTQSNKAWSVHTFGSQTVTAGTFTLTMPTNDGTTGLIRIS